MKPTLKITDLKIDNRLYVLFEMEMCSSVFISIALPKSFNEVIHSEIYQASVFFAFFFSSTFVFLTFYP